MISIYSSSILLGFQRSAILLLLILLSASNNTFGQWNGIDLGTDQTLTHITHVAGDTFYIAGFEGLYKTYNAGANWTNAPIDIPASYFYDMHFFNSKVGVGAGPITMANSQCIVKTTDGGQHWNIVYVSNGGNWPREFNDIEFTSASTGYAVGRNGKVLKTTNRGTSWSEVPVNTFSTNNFLGVTFDSSGRGYLLSAPWLEEFDGTKIIQTEYISANNSFVMAKAFNASEIMLASKATFAHKNNGIWTKYDFPYAEVTTLFVYSSQVIYLGTDNGLYISRNGGTLWEYFKETQGMQVKSIFIRNDGKGFVVGVDGKIFATNNFGGSSSPVVDFEISSKGNCDVTTIRLQNKTYSGYQFRWYLNDKLISTQFEDSIKFVEPFNGSISLVADNGQKKDTLTTALYVDVQSVNANAGSDVHACYDEIVKLNATSTGGYYYQWYPSTGLNDSGIANPVSHHEGTIEYVVAVSNDHGCVDRDTVTIFRNDAISNLEWKMTTVTTESPVSRVQMVNDTLGYALATNRLLVTTDGGLQWTENPTPVTSEWGSFNDLQFITADSGFATCRFLYKTEDAGDTYKVDYVTSNVGSILDIEFITTRVGYAAVTVISGGYAVIMKTTNGGELWTEQTGVIGQIYKISCQDNGTCVAVGNDDSSSYGALFLFSTDGEHWQKANFPVSDYHTVYDVFFVNNETGYAVSMNSKLWKTTDGGASWKIDYVLPDWGTSIEFVDENRGFIGSYNGELFQTVNGGACWQNMGRVHTTWITELHIYKNYIFMAGGETIFANGIIYRADLSVVGRKNQGITFPPFNPKKVGDPDFEISAVSSSGLPLTYVSANENVATTNGSKLTITGGGSVEITATQVGDATYLPATPVKRTLYVDKGNQQINFTDLPEKNYGDADFTLNAEASSQLPISYSADNLNRVEIQGNLVKIKSAGSVNITASQMGNANYQAAASVTRKLTINKASQQIVFAKIPENLNRNEMPISLEASASSGLPVAFMSSNVNVVSVNGSQGIFVGTGVANLSAVQNGDSNYKAADPVSQTITIDFVLGAENPHGSPTLFFNPNPVLQWLNVDLSGFKKGEFLSIEIVDGFGRMMSQQQSIGDDHLTLDLKELKAGVYFLIVKQNATVKTGKLIKH